jgi:gliding motility-associated lipoprotein GldH
MHKFRSYLYYFLPGFALLTVFLTSCDSRDIIFEKKVELKDKRWTYADSLQYTFPIKDTTKIYSIYLQVAHEQVYPFQNIYLMLHTQFPSGKRIDNRINIDLAEPTGKWNGDCSGDVCELEIPIQEGAYFNETGNYTLTVEQYLRQDTLVGISAVKVMLEDTGKKRGK